MATVTKPKTIPSKKPATPAASKPTAAKKEAKSGGQPSADELSRWVAEAAYYRAEKRGFSHGQDQGDWLEAEQEILRKLGR
ncbi:MAG: DUF2934 domain-containing protein [Deltaproteobacteria bacterium]|nr:DUF2934 domain-containing protein [Deltaproteobacteria bacterium]